MGERDFYQIISIIDENPAIFMVCEDSEFQVLAINMAFVAAAPVLFERAASAVTENNMFFSLENVGAFRVEKVNV